MKLTNDELNALKTITNQLHMDIFYNDKGEPDEDMVAGFLLGMRAGKNIDIPKLMSVINALPKEANIKAKIKKPQ